MVRRSLLGLVLLVFLFVVGDAADFPVPGEGVFADTWECVEYNTGYSLDCKASSGTCGTSCFYANCIKCSDGCHTHCASCGEDCVYCWDERHGESPCVDWTWHLYGEDPGAKRTTGLPFNDCDGGMYYLHSGGGGYYGDKQFSQSTPRLGPALGLIGPQPMRNKCFEDGVEYDPTPQPSNQPDTSGGGTVFLDNIHAGVTPETTVGGGGATSGLEAAFFSGGMDVRRRVSIADLDTKMDKLRELAEVGGMPEPSGLAVIPGEFGSPSLLSVVKVSGSDSAVTLSVGGVHVGVLQYRYWMYNGHVPDEHNVPFQALPLSGIVMVDRSGVYSFQVRALDTVADEEISSGRSNVVHQIMGPPGSSFSPGLLVPARVPTPDPLPTLEYGTRPSFPSIASVAEVPGVPGDVRVVLSPGYSGRLEYRVWSHTGWQPNSEDDDHVPDSEDDDLWRVSGSGDFLVRGLDFPLFWSFQARVVDVHDVPSEPSEVMSIMVWGNPGLVNSDFFTRISGMLDLPPRDRDLPASGAGVRPDSPEIQAVDEVLGMPGRVRVTMRSHSGALQLRRWLHTGRLPVAAHEGERWDWLAVSPDFAGEFTVDLPGYPTGFPGMWDFQTRVMGPGGLESEPSNVVSLMVWGEIAPSPTPCTTWDTRFGGPWLCFT